MKRNAIAVWQGTGKEGKGHLSTESNALNQAQYTYSSRFENGAGTNPDELIAAAHAGCFTLKLAFLLNAEGFTADNLETNCEVTLENGVYTGSKLVLTGAVPGISKEKFDEIAENAKVNCTISKLLNTEIILETNLGSVVK